jgi:hypothetical protein
MACLITQQFVDGGDLDATPSDRVVSCPVMMTDNRGGVEMGAAARRLMRSMTPRWRSLFRHGRA